MKIWYFCLVDWNFQKGLSKKFILEGGLILDNVEHILVDVDEAPELDGSNENDFI